MTNERNIYSYLPNIIIKLYRYILRLECSGIRAPDVASKSKDAPGLHYVQKRFMPYSVHIRSIYSLLYRLQFLLYGLRHITQLGLVKNIRA